MIAAANEVYVAWAQASFITPNNNTRTTADASRTPRTLISPVPSFGNRSATCDRSGRPRPRTTTTIRITRNAGMRLSPAIMFWWKKSWMSPP